MSTPTGLVALVNTDVERCTPLWEAVPDAMAEAMALHDGLLRALLHRAGGYEVRVEGDAFIAAFSDPVAAVRWCLDAQDALATAPWPDALLTRPEASPRGSLRGLRVRMGVHLGQPVCQLDPTTGRMTYRGLAAARGDAVARAAHGGQVLISQSVLDAAGAALGADPDIALRDLGEHRLRGMEAKDRLTQVQRSHLADRVFAPPVTAETRRGNLPPEPTALIGRRDALVSIDEAYTSGARLVTLLGPGGMGKTRLAIHYATTRQPLLAADGGAWFFDLSELRDLSGLINAVATALQVTLRAGNTLDKNVAQLGRVLADQMRTLWVLDNAEQIAFDVARTIETWLDKAPQARVLVTSRERLRCPGELTLDLAPLGISEAADLFVARAQAARANFSLGAGDLAIVEEIVTRLDGIPLAIELAAARTSVLSVRALQERLPNRFQLLQGRRRDAKARQSTLQGAIQWSWEMLSDAEREALACCAVFQGGFEPAAAAAVLPDSAEGALNLLAALREKSLLRTWVSTSSTTGLRYGMYESIRAFAQLRLTDSGARQAAERAHWTWYAAECAHLANEAAGPEGARAVRVLAEEFDNIQGALSRALDAPDGIDSALKLLAGVEALLSSRGVLEPLLALANNTVAVARASSKAALAEALYLRGSLLRYAEQLNPALEDSTQVRALCSALDLPALDCRAASLKGRILRELRGNDEALKELAAAVELSRKHGLPEIECVSLSSLGLLLLNQGHHDEAERRFREALAVARRIGHRRTEATVLGNLGVYCQERGRWREALELIEAAMEAHRALGNRRNEAGQWNMLGVLNLDLGNHERAAEAMRRAMVMQAEVGLPSRAFVVRTELGLLEMDRGDLDTAEATFRAVLGEQAPDSPGFARPLAMANLGILLHRRGRPADALATYEEALTSCAEASFYRGAAYVGVFRAAALADLDRVEEAELQLADSEAETTRIADQSALCCVSLVRGDLELAYSRRALAAGDLAGASAHLHSAQARRASVEQAGDASHLPMVQCSHDVRLAAKILDIAIDRTQLQLPASRQAS